MQKIILIGCLLSMSTMLFAQTWYVSGKGNDSNDGKTLKTAFRSLQKAADLVQAGDKVLIDKGIYTNADKSNGSAVLSIKSSGKPNAWITWQALKGTKPDIRPTGWCGIDISGSYHIIDGLTVTGSNDSIVLLAAQEDAKKPKPNPYFNTNGIVVNGRNNKPDAKPHHVIIRNCVVTKCPGGGVVGLETDYLTVEDCLVSENAWFMRYGGSGISTLNNWAFDDAAGYHIIIQRNFVWNNKTLVPWEKIGKLSDGNGIILDVTDQTNAGATNPNADAVTKPADTAAAPILTKPKRPEWKARALIANNLSAFNGGSGIHTFRTKYVDIVNNTTYHNGGIVGYAELFANNSEDVVILNNIIVPRPNGKVTSNNKNKNIKWDYNLYPVEQDIFKASHDIVSEPQFINPQLNVLQGNFKLSPRSAALHSGTRELQQSSDLNHRERLQGKGIDRGCYEQ